MLYRDGRTVQEAIVLAAQVAVAVEELGAALKWEPSRDGALFPHLYGALPLTAVRWVKPIRRDDDGRHLLPPLEA